VVLSNDQLHRRRYSSEHRQAITKSTANSVRSSLKKLWAFIASNPIAVFDQVIDLPSSDLLTLPASRSADPLQFALLLALRLPVA
jgi:hypothetical protein